MLTFWLELSSGSDPGGLLHQEPHQAQPSQLHTAASCVGLAAGGRHSAAGRDASTGLAGSRAVALTAQHSTAQRGPGAGCAAGRSRSVQTAPPRWSSPSWLQECRWKPLTTYLLGGKVLHLNLSPHSWQYILPFHGASGAGWREELCLFQPAQFFFAN